MAPFSLLNQSAPFSELGSSSADSAPDFGKLFTGVNYIGENATSPSPRNGSLFPEPLPLPEKSFLSKTQSVATSMHLHEDGFLEMQNLQPHNKSIMFGPGKFGQDKTGYFGIEQYGCTILTKQRLGKAMHKTQLSSSVISEVDTGRTVSYCPWPPKHFRSDKRKTTIVYKGGRFASLTEAALAGILERYVPGFYILEGETYEVPLLGKSKVDFCVNGVLIEFHTPRLGTDESNIGDFLTREEYSAFMLQLRKVGRNKHQRKKLLKETRAKVFQTYAERRQTLLSLSHKQGRELVIVKSREEFYDQVLCRFAKPAAPLFAEFLVMYWWLIDVVLRESDMPRLRTTAC